MYGVESLPVLIKELPSTWIIDANGAIVGKMNYVPPHRLLALLDKAAQ